MKGDFSGYTVERMAEMFTWPRFNGFSGETCGECRKTANVPAGGPGWFCECGHFNVQSWRFHQMPHEMPDLGPTRIDIQKAVELSRRTSDAPRGT